MPSETPGRNGAFKAKFRTRRPSRTCETRPCRAVFGGIGMLAGGDPTGWLGRRDSNLRIRNRARWAYRYRAVRRVAADRAPDPQQARARSDTPQGIMT